MTHDTSRSRSMKGVVRRRTWLDRLCCMPTGLVGMHNAVLCITCRRLDKLCQRLNLHELPLKVLWFRISTDIVRYRGNITICFNESATLSGRCSARWKCLFFFLFFLLFITLAFFGHFFYAFLLLQRILAPFRLFLSTTQQNIRSDDMAWQEQLQ